MTLVGVWIAEFSAKGWGSVDDDIKVWDALGSLLEGLPQLVISTLVKNM
jgi:hypothetical protein